MAILPSFASQHLSAGPMAIFWNFVETKKKRIRKIKKTMNVYFFIQLTKKKEKKRCLERKPRARPEAWDEARWLAGR